MSQRLHPVTERRRPKPQECDLKRDLVHPGHAGEKRTETRAVLNALCPWDLVTYYADKADPDETLWSEVSARALPEG